MKGGREGEERKRKREKDVINAKQNSLHCTVVLVPKFFFNFTSGYIIINVRY